MHNLNVFLTGMITGLVTALIAVLSTSFVMRKLEQRKHKQNIKKVKETIKKILTF